MTIDSISECLELRNFWYVVANSQQIDTAPICIRLLNNKIVLWRDSDHLVVASDDYCPHRQAPLSQGHVENGCLSCPYHGWKFGKNGRCIRIPSSDSATPIPPRAHLTTYQVVERYGLIWICLGEPNSGVPEIPEDTDPKHRRYNTEMQTWQCSVTRMVDNFLDYSHFPFVHKDSIGKGIDPFVQPIQLEDLGDNFFGYKYHVDAGNPPDAVATTGSTTTTSATSVTTAFMLPFLVRGTMTWVNGLRQVLLMASTPIDDITSLFTFVIWRNDLMPLPDNNYIDFELLIDREDQIMLEMLRGPLPVDTKSLVNVQADKASVEWRRRLLKVMTGTTLTK